MIGVIIPYYQRTPGLLRRALQSVATQVGAPPFRVYVVDDGSPSPAEAELQGLAPGFAERIVIIRRSNGGPGAARNAALDRLAPDVNAVAFLDSDDAWTPDHLQRAWAALEAGADLYFADHRREDDPENRFRQCGYRPDGKAIEALPDAYWADAQAVFRVIVERSPVGTSTVVIRRSRLDPVRFPRGLRSAGEDSMLWLEVLCRGVRAACSLRSEAAYGRGVSIFNHRSWGDARSLRTTLDEMRAQHFMRRRFRLSGDLRARSRAQCQALDQAFCAGLLACARRAEWRAAAPALSYLAIRPQAILRLPQAARRAVRRGRPAVA